MAIHHLKTWPAIYADIESGKKPFDVRLNDRNFQIGDTLVFDEYYPTNGQLTGRSIERIVSYILEGGKFGIMDGYVAMGLNLKHR